MVAEGRHDVRGGGPTGWNAFTRRAFQFGGYGYFTHRNWWYEFDPTEGAWSMLEGNRPGTSPFPRETQIAPGTSQHCMYLFSGIGGETGIQWEHRARNGLPVASEIGWYTWLRDLWHLDLSTRKWTCVLEPNHPSIRQEGKYTYNAAGGWHLLRGGGIPAETWGEPSVPVNILQGWDGETPDGFQPLPEEGEIPAYSATGRWLSVPGSPTVLWIDGANRWTCSLVRR